MCATSSCQHSKCHCSGLPAWFPLLSAAEAPTIDFELTVLNYFVFTSLNLFYSHISRWDLFLDSERWLKEKWWIKLECFWEYWFGKIPDESNVNKNRLRFYCFAVLKEGEKRFVGELTSLAAVLQRFLRDPFLHLSVFKDSAFSFLHQYALF